MQRIPTLRPTNRNPLLRGFRFLFPDTQTDKTGIFSPERNSIDNNRQAAGRRGQFVRQMGGYRYTIGCSSVSAASGC